jgi:phage baseplate assembly protein gpV
MAGPFDFTGQNIEDSYQRVLQTDGTLVYDGTGSLFTINSTSASYALTASYVLDAISSSFASTASFVTLAQSASYALTASYISPSSIFPYTGSALITGSLGITGSLDVQGDITQNGVDLNSLMIAYAIALG